MPLILIYIYVVLSLGALSALAQIIVATYKALPAFLLKLLSVIITVTVFALYIAAYPVTMPYAIYKAKGKWSTGARFFVFILYLILMLLTCIIIYLSLASACLPF